MQVATVPGSLLGISGEHFKGPVLDLPLETPVLMTWGCDLAIRTLKLPRRF